MNPSTESHKVNRNRRGGSSIEFVIVAAFYFVPMILGTFAIGFNLIRAMQAIQVTRDVGHMFGKGVDFSQQANQNIVVNELGTALNLQGNGGNVTGGATGDGVIILSAITYVGPSQCSSCANRNHYVVLRRIVIGNKSLRTSTYGGNMTLDSTGAVKNSTTDNKAQADQFSKILTLKGGEMAFLAESYFAAPGLTIPGLISSEAAYNYAVF